jgi:hypothetical protein
MGGDTADYWLLVGSFRGCEKLFRYCGGGREWNQEKMSLTAVGRGTCI